MVFKSCLTGIRYRFVRMYKAIFLCNRNIVLGKCHALKQAILSLQAACSKLCA